MSLASVQDLKDFITSTSVTLPASCTDAILQAWLDAATAEIQCSTLCAQPLEQTSIEYRFTGLGWSEKLIPYHPVTSLDDVEERVGGTWQTIASSDYFLDETDGIYRIAFESGRGAFHEGRRYRATMMVGYAPGAVPADIRQVCVEMAALQFYDSPHSAGGPRFALLSKITSASSSETYDRTRLRSAWREKLARYRVSPGY